MAFLATLLAALLVGFGIGAISLQEETTNAPVPDTAAPDDQEGKPAPAPAAPPSGASGDDQSSGASGDDQTYSGNGGKSLGTLNVPADAVLEWTNDGASFQIFSAERVPVNSQAKSGDTVLTKGKYTDLQVNAVGNWTIKIRPR